MELDLKDLEIIRRVADLERTSMTGLERNVNQARQTMYNHVQKLVNNNFLAEEKTGFPRTRFITLTEKGKALLLELDRLQADLADVEQPLEDLDKTVARQLYIRGYAMDLQPRRGFWAGFTGFLLIKDLARAFLRLGDMEKEYLSFLAKLYIHSPKKFLDKHDPHLGPLELRAAWQLVRRGGWDEPDVREGFLFSFPDVWDDLYSDLTDELKNKMRERDLTKERIFKKLRGFSFPISQRMKLVREG